MPHPGVTLNPMFRDPQMEARFQRAYLRAHKQTDVVWLTMVGTIDIVIWQKVGIPENAPAFYCDYWAPQMSIYCTVLVFTVPNIMYYTGLGRVNNWTLKNTFYKGSNLMLPTQKWLAKGLVFMLKPLGTPLMTFLTQGLPSLAIEQKP